MGVVPPIGFSPEQTQDYFLAAQPYLSSRIMDLTIAAPNFMSELPAMEEFPLGQGTTFQQLVYRGQMPQIERGFDAWKARSQDSGCDPCANDCAYNWTQFGGSGLDRKIAKIMDRDFKSNAFCVREIQTTANFNEVMSQIVLNLYRQIAFFKEFNVAQNFLTSIAKKTMIDSTGFKFNPEDPYVYRNVGTATLGRLSIQAMTKLYEWMRREPSVIPFDIQNGAPLYAIMASDELLQDVYRVDTELRQDIRFSGFADANVTRYNFLSSFRGMFLQAPILYPRRFTLNADADPVEVLPFVNGVPAERGSYTANNPAYDAAPYEEVILTGRSPFKVLFQQTASSVGGGTSFGPEFSFMNNWMWINVLTDNDPFRRSGFYATSASIALAPQYSEGVIGLLVARPSYLAVAQFNPITACPPTPPTCNNAVPDVTCPCPIVLSATPDPFVASAWNIELATPIDVEAEDPISFVLQSGTTIDGEVVQVNAAGTLVQVTLPDTFTSETCNQVIEVECEAVGACSSEVSQAGACSGSVINTIDVPLQTPIVATTVGNVVTGFFADGSTKNLTVVSVSSDGIWRFSFTGTICDLGGLYRVCVPTSTNAACPACSGTVTACSDE